MKIIFLIINLLMIKFFITLITDIEVLISDKKIVRLLCICLVSIFLGEIL